MCVYRKDEGNDSRRENGFRDYNIEEKGSLLRRDFRRIGEKWELKVRG